MDFNKLFNGLPEALIALSPEYKVLAVTDAYLRASMRSREQILGLHFLLEAFPEKELSYEENPVKKALDKVLVDKKPVLLDVFRYGLLKPTGEYEVRYWEVSHTPVLDERGEVIYIIQKSLDVTERENTKNALTESEEKFKFMAEAVPQLIFTADKDGNANYFNTRWEEYTGIQVEKLLQNSWREIIHPEDLPNTKAKWEQALKGGTSVQLELRKRDKNGMYRWHLCRSLPMKNKEGDIAMWVGSSTDIHDTRQIVQELVESNEQLVLLSNQVQQAFEKAESERKTLETLIMEAPAMFVMLKGPEHRFELINEKYQELYPGKELIGLTISEALPEIVEQGFVVLLDQVYNTGETFVAEEVPIMLPKNGTGPLEEKFFNFSYQPIYDYGKIAGILAFGYDISNEVLFKKKMQDLEKL